MRKEDGKKFFYQWELGQRLIVDEDCTLVQFSNGTFTNALGCEVKEENGVRYVEVPNILLQTAADLHAYAWDEKTTSVIGHNVFSVVPMPKPDNYVYTETDVLTWKSFEMRIRRYEGEGNVVGLRGYYWSQIMFNQDGLGGAVALTDSSDIPAVIPQEVAKISDVLADFENPYSAGDVFSMVNGGQYALCGTITGVDNNVIYFSCTKSYMGFPEYSVGEGTTRVKQMDPVSRAFDDYTFGVIEKADKGIVEIVKGSVAIGINNRSTGNSSFAEGKDNVAYGDYAHAEGRLNRAAYAAHAEGRENDASGWYSHAEGYRSKATEQQAHAEGRMTLASGQAAHAEGNTSQATGNSSHAEGEETIAGAIQAHAEGCRTQATAQAAHSEGFNTKARGFASHSEGRGSVADGYVSHAEGEETQATGSTSHAEGRLTTASNQAAHAEGEGTTASGRYSHAEGYKTQASGQESHAEGYQTKATDSQAHAEGHTTTASGHTSHAEGYGTVASGEYSHAEGYQTKATSYAAHAEGVKTVAEGQFTHAEGYETQATNQYAHAEGYGTIASGLSTHAEGRFNVGDTEGKFLHIVGNGTSNANRSNAFAVDKDGNGYYGGDLFAKCGKDSTRGTKVDVDKLAKLDVNSVSFGAEQNLSDDQKARARGNIGAASAIVCEASGEVIAVSDTSDRQLQGLTLYGKTTQDGTPTPENPIELVSVGSGGSVGVTVCGKNLYKGEYYGGYQQTPIPTDWGCYAGSAYAVYMLYVEVKKGVTYTVTTYKPETSTAITTLGFTDIHPNKLVNGQSPCVGYQRLSAGANTATATAPFDGWLTCLAYNHVDNAPIETQRNMFQVEIGEKSTEYEPYNAQTLTAQTPNGLLGVPLGATIPDFIKANDALMAGVWWDEETQQYYVSDTKEFARSTNVQRIGVIPSWGGEEISTPYMSTSGGLNDGDVVQYVLDAPIETLLSAEEISAYSALHTNKPNTTVFNDSGAGMKVEYVADSKSYIDNNLAKQAADDSTVGDAPWSSRKVCENYAVRTSEITSSWIGKPVEGSTITAYISCSFDDNGEPLHEPVVRHFGLNLLGREREGEGFTKTEVANCGVTITRAPIYTYTYDYETGEEIKILASEDGDRFDGEVSSDFSYVRSIITLYPGTYTLRQAPGAGRAVAMVATTDDGEMLCRISGSFEQDTFTLEKTAEVTFAYQFTAGKTLSDDRHYPFLVLGDTALHRDENGDYIYCPEYKCETITGNPERILLNGPMPVELKAYPGINTILMQPLYGSSVYGENSVTYYEQPEATIERLTNAIIALGGNI